MAYDLIIANGTVLHAHGHEKADVAIRGEQIAAVAPGLAQSANGAKVLDATGKYVMPGGVDPHVHLELPFCGTVSSDDWRTGTRAAARGGVTTVIDFAIPYGEQSLDDAYHAWLERAKPKACIDFAFHMAITNWDRHGPEMEKMVRKGCPTFKEFMIYASEGWQADDRAIFNTLERARELGAMLLVHAESSRVLDELIARHHNPDEMKKLGARLHAITRPNFIEAEAIQRAIMWAEVTKGRLYIVHMSTGEGTEIVRAARKRGVDVYAETCVQYLVLEDSVFAQPDGHLFACCPQLKKPKDQERLWEGLNDDDVCVISTDTCTQPRPKSSLGRRLDEDPHGASRPGDFVAIGLYARRFGQTSHAQSVRRQVLHEPGQDHGPLPAQRRFSCGQRCRRRGLRPGQKNDGRFCDHGNGRRLEPIPRLVVGGLRGTDVLPGQAGGCGLALHRRNGLGQVAATGKGGGVAVGSHVWDISAYPDIEWIILIRA